MAVIIKISVFCLIVAAAMGQIAAPSRPPVFSTENGIDISQDCILVEEGKTVTVVCEVFGGNPQVKETIIQCDGNHVKDQSGRASWSNSGYKVRVTLDITKAMDQKMCTCKANHVTGSYNKTTSLTFSVPHVAEIVSFKVNEAPQLDTTVDVNAEVTFKCEARGNPLPRFSFSKLDGNSKIQIEQEESSESLALFTLPKASCDSSGTYECAVKNNLSPEPVVRQVNLRVRCPPQPCSNKVGARGFSIVPGKMVRFEMCIFAFPNPHPDIRISKKGKNLDEGSYNTKYTNTNSLKTKGFVAIRMYKAVTQLGNYTIDFWIQSQWQRIDFSLVPYQAPSCPKSLNVSIVGSTFVIVSWQSAFDLGIPQTFTLIRINNKDGVVDEKNIEDDREEVIFHNSTGLNSSTQYTLKLGVRNDIGSTECPHLTVNVTTTQALFNNSQSLDDADRMVVVASTECPHLTVNVTTTQALFNNSQSLDDADRMVVVASTECPHLTVNETTTQALFNNSQCLDDADRMVVVAIIITTIIIVLIIILSIVAVCMRRKKRKSIKETPHHETRQQTKFRST